MKYLKTTIFCLCVSFNLYATEYHVSKQGNDINEGASALPFIEFIEHSTKADFHCYINLNIAVKG